MDRWRNGLVIYYTVCTHNTQLYTPLPPTYLPPCHVLHAYTYFNHPTLATMSYIIRVLYICIRCIRADPIHPFMLAVLACPSRSHGLLRQIPTGRNGRGLFRLAILVILLQKAIVRWTRRQLSFADCPTALSCHPLHPFLPVCRLPLPSRVRLGCRSAHRLHTVSSRARVRTGDYRMRSEWLVPPRHRTSYIHLHAGTPRRLNQAILAGRPAFNVFFG